MIPSSPSVPSGGLSPLPLRYRQPYYERRSLSIGADVLSRPHQRQPVCFGGSSPEGAPSSNAHGTEQHPPKKLSKRAKRILLGAMAFLIGALIPLCNVLPRPGVLGGGGNGGSTAGGGGGAPTSLVTTRPTQMSGNDPLGLSATPTEAGNTPQTPATSPETATALPTETLMPSRTPPPPSETPLPTATITPSPLPTPTVTPTPIPDPCEVHPMGLPLGALLESAPPGVFSDNNAARLEVIRLVTGALKFEDDLLQELNRVDPEKYPLPTEKQREARYKILFEQTLEEFSAILKGQKTETGQLSSDEEAFFLLKQYLLQKLLNPGDQGSGSYWGGDTLSLLDRLALNLIKDKENFGDIALMDYQRAQALETLQGLLGPVLEERLQEMPSDPGCFTGEVEPPPLSRESQGLLVEAVP